MTIFHERANDLEELARGIDFVDGTAFYFLVVNDPRTRNGVIRELETHLRRRRIRHLAIRRGSDSFPRLVRTIPFNGKREVLVVTGVENVLERDAPFLRSLNAVRDSLAHVLDGPVLFVLSNEALVAVMNEAPDFFSTRSGTFFFDDAGVEHFRPKTSVHRSAGVDMTPAEVRARIRDAEELLAEWAEAPENTPIDYYLRPARRLIDLLITVYEVERAEEIARRAFELARDERPAEAVHFALTLSQIARLRGDPAEARRYACVVRDLADRAGDRASLMRAHWLAAESAPSPKEEEEDFQRALELAVWIGDIRSRAQIEMSMGLKQLARGAFTEALAMLRNAHDDADRVGDRPLVAEILSTTASALTAMGRFSEAEEAARQSLQEFERLRDDVQAGMAYIELGDVYLAQHRLEDAEEAFRRSLEVTQRSRLMPTLVIPPLLRLINIAITKKELGSAERLADEALALIDRFRDELPDLQEAQAQLRLLVQQIHATTP